MVVLKQFKKNLFHMLRSFARISWDTGVPLGGKGCIFPFIKNTEYNYICIYTIIYIYIDIIICTPKCDTFGNSFFTLLSIMECYKLNR